MPGRPAAPLPAALLLSALCCVPIQAPLPLTTCFSPQLNATLVLGEQRMLPGCGGLITCTERFGLQHTRCNSENNICRRLESNPALADAPFPACCPRVTCDECHSAELNRYFGPGESWTDGPCVHHQCQVSRTGLVEVIRTTCRAPDPPPPIDDCELVGQDISRGGYPLCCAHYRCAGHCLLKNEKWIATGRTETNACTAQQALGVVEG